MAFWNIDLTTRMGAESATHQGSLGAFVFTAQAVIGGAIAAGALGYETELGIATLIGAGLEALVALVAGFRFRAGKGAFWGMAAAALLAIEMISKIITMNGLAGLVINIVVLVVIVQGIRGALALRGEARFEDDDIEVFE